MPRPAAGASLAKSSAYSCFERRDHLTLEVDTSLSSQRVTCALEDLIKLRGRLLAVRKAGFHCVQKHPRRESKVAKNRTPN
jgi:hypothetical protein